MRRLGAHREPKPRAAELAVGSRVGLRERREDFGHALCGRGGGRDARAEPQGRLALACRRRAAGAAAPAAGALTAMSRLRVAHRVEHRAEHRIELHHRSGLAGPPVTSPGPRVLHMNGGAAEPVRGRRRGAAGPRAGWRGGHEEAYAAEPGLPGVIPMPVSVTRNTCARIGLS